MTSNVSFLTNCKENFKRRTWATLLMGLFFFIFYIISPVVIVNQVNYSQENLKAQISSFHSLMTYNFGTGFFVTILAILFALQGFSYLYNRQKMDLYLSVPLSTKKRFHVIQLTSLFTFITLYLISGSFGLLIGTSGGLTSFNTVQDFFFSFFLHTLLFVSIYELTCIAIMMSGHIIVSILALSVFSFYELFARALHSEYISSFMNHLIPENITYLITSPFYPYYRIINVLARTFDKKTVNASFYIENILGLFLFCVIFYLLAYILYRKRPNEATDRAISFAKTKPWINVFLQVLAALGGGLFFYSISWSNISMAILGIFLGAFIVFCTMNIIYDFDIKSIFKKWYTFAISIGIALLYFLIITQDFLGIDTYVPTEKKVESCGISSYTLPQIGYAFDGSSYQFYFDSDLVSKEMRITDTSPFIEMAKKALEKEQDYTNGEDISSYTICFQLENGKTVYRRYSLGLESVTPQLKRIFESDDYIDSTKGRIDKYLSKQSDAELYFSNGVYDIHLSSDNKAELIEAYFKDLKQFNYEENVLGVPFSEWIFKPKTGNSLTLPIYSNFSATVSLLDSYNLTKEVHLDAKDVEKINLYLYPIPPNIASENLDYNQEIVTREYPDDTFFREIKEPREIEILLQNTFSARYFSHRYNSSIIEHDSKMYSVSISVLPKIGSIHEEEIYYSGFEYKGLLPSFINLAE